jgi:lipid-A-disaccharide synthase
VSAQTPKSAGASGAGGPLIFLMAGEPSGDALGARLMAALRRETNGAVRFAGIGGERMIAEGLESQFPMAELSIMGLAEVLPRAFHVLRRVRETVTRIERLRPSAVVSIDATGFCFRVEKRLKARGAGIPLIHYVAPMVWAWRPWKAKLVARFLDHLMTLLPFEPPYFEKEGLAATFVGHPVIEEGAERGDGAAFRARHGIPADAPVLAVLPGSRRGEVTRLLPVFAETLERLKAEFPDLRVVVATVGTVADRVTAAAASWPVPAVVLRGRGEKYDAFAAANAALAASGTISLELALARCPMVIAYKVSPVTAWLLRHVFRINVRYATIVNIMLDRELIPELLQENCRPDLLAGIAGRLLRDPAARRAQTEGAAPALQALGLDGPAPSTRAARVVLAVISSKTRTAPIS